MECGWEEGMGAGRGGRHVHEKSDGENICVAQSIMHELMLREGITRRRAGLHAGFLQQL